MLDPIWRGENCQCPSLGESMVLNLQIMNLVQKNLPQTSQIYAENYETKSAGSVRYAGDKIFRLLPNVSSGLYL
jgi:hypothetical protein